MLPWIEHPCIGPPPSHRYGGSAAVWRGRLFCFGGAGGGATRSNALHMYDPAARRWQRVERQCMHDPWPRPRTGHSLCEWRDHLVLFGGEGPDEDGRLELVNDVWLYDLCAGRWRLCMPRMDEGLKEGPCPRRSHAACVWKDRMVIYGGLGALPSQRSPVTLGDVFSLDLMLMVWHRTYCTGGSPGRRMGHAHCHVNGVLFIHGGLQSPILESTTRAERGEALRQSSNSLPGLLPRPRSVLSTAGLADVVDDLRARLLQPGPAPGAHFQTSSQFASRALLHSKSSTTVCPDGSLYGLDLARSHWAVLDSPMGPQPPPAVGHSLTCGHGTLIMFGGTPVPDTAPSDQLWTFHRGEAASARAGSPSSFLC